MQVKLVDEHAGVNDATPIESAGRIRRGGDGNTFITRRERTVYGQDSDYPSSRDFVVQHDRISKVWAGSALTTQAGYTGEDAAHLLGTEHRSARRFVIDPVSAVDGLNHLSSSDGNVVVGRDKCAYSAIRGVT